MARIRLEAVRHSYGEGDALRPADIEFEDGGAYALLGPSGCGKTTLLNIVSGLIRPSAGRVLFDDRDVTDLDTAARNIAQVFQFPVVYDTMTVAQNLAFPLRNRGLPAGQVRQRVGEVLEMLDLTAVANRRATRLSADDKQKVSLGRGLVRSDVAAILFDEPLTVIDPQAKWRLRAQLKLLHRQFGHTMVYVTHDQTEALTFADRVAVMRDGAILQIGSAQELFDAPRHTFVGYFIGSPGMNVLPVEAEGGALRIGQHAIAMTSGPTAPGARVELGVRPEHIRLGREGLPVQVRRVDDVGRRRIVHAALAGHELQVSLDEAAEIPAEPRVAFEPGRAGVFVDSWRVGA
ncbi:ABC transporter ATP-binding protein [Phenylobacterium sp.]|uniref:ABC transporter ATP-binding protein n=1 Tax=Phenylobacterium sp. TaxID=1871053 RepID=UPI003565809F